MSWQNRNNRLRQIRQKHELFAFKFQFTNDWLNIKISTVCLHWVPLPPPSSATSLYRLGVYIKTAEEASYRIASTHEMVTIDEIYKNCWCGSQSHRVPLCTLARALTHPQTLSNCGTQDIYSNKNHNNNNLNICSYNHCQPYWDVEQSSVMSHLQIYRHPDTHTHIQISSHPKVTGKTVNSVEWNNSHSHTLPYSFPLHTVGCIRPCEEDLSKINNCDGVSMCGGGTPKNVRDIVKIKYN